MAATEATAEEPSSARPMLDEAGEQDRMIDVEEGGDLGHRAEDTPARQPAFARGDSTSAGRSNACVASIVLTSLCLSALLVVGGRHLLDQEDPSWGRQAETEADRALLVLGVGAPAANGTDGNRTGAPAIGTATGPAAASSAGGNSSEALAAGAGEGPGDGNLSGPACSPALCGALDRAGETFKEAQHWGGWAKVFPFMVTSTSTTSTTTTWTTSTTTSTTTSSTTPCAVPQKGDACYKEVLRIMYDVQAGADHKTHFNNWSSFEEVQKWVHKTSEATCPEVCECHPGWVGSQCYESVIYAMNVGMRDHPEWYPGLSPNSSFDKLQDYLSIWDNRSECAKSCMSYPKPDVSLFCWSVSRKSGYEADIMKAQLSRGAGIFGCDGFAVVCESEWNVGWGPGERIGEVNAVTFKGAAVGTSKDGTAGNAELFMNAWEAMLKQTAVLKFDWAIKVDPDAVVVADRLRDHLRGWSGKKAFVRNCNKKPLEKEFPMMFGSLEAISSAALAVYKDEAERCKNELEWRPWGEDFFLGKCLPHLGIDPVDDFTIISDGVCTDVNCYDSWSAAFHPFKSAQDWVTCWEAATAGGSPGPLLPPRP